MYEELVKRLRDRARREDSYYEHGGDIINEAANAIEELSGLISRYDGETGIKSEKSKREDHDDVSVDFGFTCEVCALFKHNVSAFDTGCEGDSEICERFDPLD